MPRKGGDARGNSRDRAARKLWMLATFGNGAECECVHCGDTLNYETVEADRVVPGNHGGTYRRDNVQPSCRPCNASRADNLNWTPKERVAA